MPEEFAGNGDPRFQNGNWYNPCPKHCENIFVPFQKIGNFGFGIGYVSKGFIFFGLVSINLEMDPRKS